MTQTLDRPEMGSVDVDAVKVFELGERMLDTLIAYGDMAETQIIQESTLDDLARVALTATN